MSSSRSWAAVTLSVLVIAGAALMLRDDAASLKPAAPEEASSSSSVRPSEEVDACVNAATEARIIARERACDEEKAYHIAAFESCLKKGELESACRSEWPNSRKDSCVLSPAAEASLNAGYEAAKEDCKR